jgi:hypothetical protein
MTGDESGASLIEFAILLPVLVILIFGIIEFSWAFAQVNDVRHGAREAARLAAVDYGDVSTIGAETCSRMDIGVTTPVTVNFGTLVGTGDRGSTGTVTGLFDGLLAGKALSSAIEFRLEQPISGSAQWWGAAADTFDCVSGTAS